MFKFLKKIRIPFLPKKVSLIPTEEEIVSAKERASQYPLISTSIKIQKLMENKFVAENGRQLKPAEFLSKIISYIEKSPEQSRFEFEVFVDDLFSKIPPPPPKKKRFSFLKK